MSIFNSDGQLIPAAIEVLYEMGNEGVGTAIMAIGNLREMEIRIGTPNVISVDRDVFLKIEQNPQEVVIGVTTKLNGNLKGYLLFLLSEEFVRNTVSRMLEEDIDDSQLMKNDDSLSAIREIINYMTAGYAKIIGSYLNQPVYISSPVLGVGEVHNIIDELLELTGGKVKKIACVNTQFTIIDDAGQKTNEVGRVLIFPHEECVQQFIDIMEG